MDYVIYLIATSGVVFIAALAVSVVVGYGGMLSVTHAALLGVGAYGYARLAMLGVPPILAVLAGMLIGASVGGAVGLVATRAQGEQHIVATLASQVVLVALFQRAGLLTGGDSGMANIPSLGVGAWGLAGLVWALGAALLLFYARWARSPQALVLRLARDEDEVASAFGARLAITRVTLFAVSATVIALAGALHSAIIGFVAPSDFNLNWSIMLLVIVVVGGASNPYGVLLSTLVLYVGTQVLSLLDFPSEILAPIQTAAFGAVLICIVLMRPGGFFGDLRLRPTLNLDSKSVSPNEA